MAIIANRYWTLLLVSAGAAVSYTAGLMPGFWLFFAVGVVLELIFWREFFRRRRSSSRQP
jgi:membrane protein implicated in regulation of membrane protease activity